jgi:hypothetical protein
LTLGAGAEVAGPLARVTVKVEVEVDDVGMVAKVSGGGP